MALLRCPEVQLYVGKLYWVLLHCRTASLLAAAFFLATVLGLLLVHSVLKSVKGADRFLGMEVCASYF